MQIVVFIMRRGDVVLLVMKRNKNMLTKSDDIAYTLQDMEQQKTKDVEAEAVSACL